MQGGHGHPCQSEAVGPIERECRIRPVIAHGGPKGRMVGEGRSAQLDNVASAGTTLEANDPVMPEPGLCKDKRICMTFISKDGVIS